MTGDGDRARWRAQVDGANQRVNHLAGIGCLARKDGLWRTVENHRRLLAGRGIETEEMVPLTFLMPDDWGAFHGYAASHPDEVWILKPRAAQQGEGVSVLVDPSRAEPGANWLVQRCVDRPHLIDGRKYTLCSYVAVTALEPLTAFVFEDGFAKFTNRDFAGAAPGDRFAPLMSSDLQAHDAEITVSAGNLTHKAYSARLEEEGIDAPAVFAAVRRIITFAVVAARETLLQRAWSESVNPAGGFELLGFDVIIDAGLRPWLLEVDTGPSLSVEAADRRSAAEEADLKARLIDALLCHVGRPPVDLASNVAAAGFLPLVPDVDTLGLLALPRPADLAAPGSASGPGSARSPILDVAGTSWPVGEGLLVHSSGRDKVHLLDPYASLIWAALEEGLDPESIAAELGRKVPESAWRARADVWNMLGRWTQLGLVGLEGNDRRETPHAGEISHDSLAAVGWNPEPVYRYLGVPVGVRPPSAETAGWIELALAPLRDRDATEAQEWVGVEPTHPGWVVGFGESRFPCRSVRQVGCGVRTAVIEVAGRLTREVGFRATLLSSCNGSVAMLTGRRSHRLALAAEWSTPETPCLADDLVVLRADGQVQGHMVGFVAPWNGDRHRELPGWRERDPLLIGLFGNFVRYEVLPVAESDPVRPTCLVHLTGESPSPGPLVPVPTGVMEAAADLLGSRPTSARRIDRANAGALAELAGSVRAYRAAPGNPAASSAVLHRLLEEVR